MIAEPEIHPFVRFYRYARREDNTFSSKFTLAAGTVLTSHGQRQKQVNNHKQEFKEEEPEKPQVELKRREKKQVAVTREHQPREQSKVEEDSSSSSSESAEEEEEKPSKGIKINIRQQRRKVEMTLEQYEELQKYQKINRKKITILETKQKKTDYQQLQPKRKKKYVKLTEKRQKLTGFQEERELKKQKKYRKAEQRKENQHPAFDYDEYLPLDEIQKSLDQKEQRFFKGRVEFGEGPKWRGKIVADEVEGLLLIEGKHRNRSLHDDKVYFEIIHKENDKSYCNVVHIIPAKREIIGRIDYIAGKTQYIINPINSRLSTMNVKAQSVNKDILDKIDTHYFRAEYMGWPLKTEFPECKVIEAFGKFGDIQIQTTALLRTHNVEDIEHDHDIVKEDLAKFLSRMNSKGEYEIAQEEIARREDLRKRRIFTIDPLNARDFDDALSITDTGDCFEVGVHIADASFFCQEGSFVDREARKRTTSVYLVHRVIPMLPRILCQNFCSLNPGCERLTFSLWVNVSRQGQILGEPKVTRSVIKSCARFTYEQAQAIIEGKITSQADMQEGFGCIEAGDFKEVAADIKLMHGLAAELRQRRVERGSLFFEVPRKVFKLNEQKLPQQFQIYERKQAHFLVEEFMIMANQLVGDILVRETKEKALLRRHRYPGPKKIGRFEQFMKNVGIPVKLSKETRVQDVINEVLSKEGLKQSVKDLVKFEMIGLLEAADYFLVGKTPSSTWIHYALNAPTYTHFTSPIRRYPDILVHRQLAAIIEKKQQKAFIPKELIDLCNERKLMAKRVSNGCEKIFMCLYLKENHAVARGIVTQTEDWGIKICMPSYDFKGVLRFKEIKGLTVRAVDQDEEGRKSLKMEYKNGKESTKFTLAQYQQLDLSLGCKDSFPIDYKLAIILSDPKKPGKHVTVG